MSRSRLLTIQWSTLLSPNSHKLILLPALLHITKTILRIYKVRPIKQIMFQTVGLFLSLIACQSAFSIDPIKVPSWHSVKTWRQPEGLPQDYVTCILQTSDGYLWIGT